MPNFADAMMPLRCERKIWRKMCRISRPVEILEQNHRMVGPISFFSPLDYYCFKKQFSYNTLKLRNHIHFYSGCKRAKCNCFPL